MADNTGIEWCDATWNPIRGCSRVSEGCRHCYAERVAARFNGPGQPYEGLARKVGGEARWTNDVRLIESMLDQPLRWKKPRRIFLNSMSDLFHEGLDDAAIIRIFAVMALCPQHQFLVLTKRPERMAGWLAGDGQPRRDDVYSRACSLGSLWSRRPGPGWPLPNVWLGVSVEDQATADARIPLLLETPAAVRFVSAEPLLGPVDLVGHIDGDEDRPRDWLMPTCCRWLDRRCVYEETGCNGVALDWVIAGGESGAGARPMHPAWARQLRDQCAEANVPFFFKQWGEWAPREVAHASPYTFMKPDGTFAEHFFQPGFDCLAKAGKARAGDRLDGRQHHEWPAHA